MTGTITIHKTDHLAFVVLHRGLHGSEELASFCFEDDRGRFTFDLVIPHAVLKKMVAELAKEVAADTRRRNDGGSGMTTVYKLTDQDMRTNE